MTIDPAPRLLVVSGLPGAGKSTIANALARTLVPCAHVEADRLHDFIVSGAESPGAHGASTTAALQLRLRLHNAVILARSFNESGISAVIDDIVAGNRYLDLVDELGGDPFHFVMLTPPLDVMKQRWRRMGSPFADSWDWIDVEIRTATPRVGLWIDNSELTVDETTNIILESLDRALVTLP